MCKENEYLERLLTVSKSTNGLAFGHIGKNYAKFMIHHGMYKFLPSNITKLQELLMTGSGHGYLYKNTNSLNKLIIPWVACSLIEDCIAPSGSTHVCTTNSISKGTCHRFDQAAMTLLLANNFQYNMSYYTMNSSCIEVDRCDKRNVFNATTLQIH